MNMKYMIPFFFRAATENRKGEKMPNDQNSNETEDGFLTKHGIAIGGAYLFSATSLLTAATIGTVTAIGIGSGVGVVGILVIAGISKIVNDRRKSNDDPLEVKSEEQKHDELDTSQLQLMIGSNQAPEVKEQNIYEVIKENRERLDNLERLARELQENIARVDKLFIASDRKKIARGIPLLSPSLEPYIPLEITATKQDMERELSFLEGLESRMTCPISIEPLLENHVIANDGHSYDRNLLQQHYDARKNDRSGARCPLNRTKKLTDPKKLNSSPIVNKIIEYIENVHGSYEKFKERIEILKNKILEFKNKESEDTKRESRNGCFTPAKTSITGLFGSTLKVFSNVSQPNKKQPSLLTKTQG